MSDSTAASEVRSVKRKRSAAGAISGPNDIIAAGLADAIVEYAIVNGVKPGQRMKEHILAEHFSVSRVPVREALTELASQGVVYYAPRRGARLMEVDALKLRKVLEVRERLETLALRTALQMFRSEPTAIAPLDQAIAQMEQAAAREDLFGIAKADIAFHRAICLASGNEVLVKAWTAVSRQVLIIFALEQRERCGTSRPGTGIKILYLAELVPFDGVAGAVDSEIMRINIAGFDPMAQLTVTEISASTAIFTF